MSTPTLLLIDVGNTRIKYWYQHTKNPLLPDSDAPAVLHNDDLPAAALRNQWHALTLMHGGPDEIHISHVASGALYAQLDQLCVALWPNVPIRRIHAQKQHPQLVTDYDANQLGSDRYAQVLGAQSICHEQDHIIIGAGTAMTIDGVHAGGTHIGGVIAAGLKLERIALHHYTAQLPLEGGQITVYSAPQNTQDALASGAMFSAVGAIAQFKQRYFSDSAPHLLFCGGDAQLLMAHCQSAVELAQLPMQYVPNLCLLGLLNQK